MSLSPVYAWNAVAAKNETYRTSQYLVSLHKKKVEGLEKRENECDLDLYASRIFVSRVEIQKKDIETIHAAWTRDLETAFERWSLAANVPDEQRLHIDQMLETAKTYTAKYADEKEAINKKYNITLLAVQQAEERCKKIQAVLRSAKADLAQAESACGKDLEELRRLQEKAAALTLWNMPLSK
jgi:hypothetical protein